MRYFILFLIIVAPFFHEAQLSAQPIKAPMFGNDITIKDESNLDQRNVNVCAAPNGWLYSCYWNPIENGFTYYILKSTDNGISWTELTSMNYPNTIMYLTDMEIIACGTDESNIKVFLGLVFTVDPGHWDQGIVVRFSGVTGEFEDEILHDQQDDIHDFALASDFPHQVGNTNPYSIAVLYSKTYAWWNHDELVFCSSSDGGQSFDHRQVILSSETFDLYHVDLSYAWSPAKNSGRYYAVWEEKPGLLDPTGHIYTAHSEPNYNSPFSLPINLDSLIPSAINKCSLPTIACQVDETENESSDITQVVLSEFQSPQPGTCKIIGWYNKESTYSTGFSPFILSDSTQYSSEPDIAYNSNDNTFMMTFFDSTTHRLPYMLNDLNLTTPSNWNLISEGYNDLTDIHAPYPVIKMNHSQGSGINVWVMDNENDNGVALFDAVLSTYNSNSEFTQNPQRLNIALFPNPCTSNITIQVYSEQAGSMSILIYNNLGQDIQNYSKISYHQGMNTITLDLSSFHNGCYLLRIEGLYKPFQSRILKMNTSH